MALLILPLGYGVRRRVLRCCGNLGMVITRRGWTKGVMSDKLCVVSD